MRCLLTASLFVASLTGRIYAHAHDSTAQRRKTLGFGPIHPHAVFKSSPYQIQTNGFLPMAADADPLEVARRFVQDIIDQQPTAGNGFRIRDDSYTDVNTGVTHVYVRQIIAGIEVSDGDMNINVKDGVVLSYGDSFFNGNNELLFSEDDSSHHPHRKYCEDLEDEIAQRQASFQAQTGQVVFGGSAPATPASLEPLMHLHASNCEHVEVPYIMAPSSSEDTLPAALLQFMIAATPKSNLANDIFDHYDRYLADLVVTHTSHFDGAEPAITVSNVPDAISPVKAKLAWIQVPNEAGDSTRLNVVWKFEVEMENNWYEAAVSANAPHRIISVVDWASDSPVPTPEEPETPATYKVFAWGINDPSEGNRTTEKERSDSLASPVGWHTLPFTNDPAMRGARLSSKEFYRNTTTTWGNNVFAHENWEGQNAWENNYRPDAGKGKAFDFKYEPAVTNKSDAIEAAKKYINATVTQLFYTSNMVHDLYYRYGFDEVSGNFQQYNFGRGGAENDAVIANAVDGSGLNNGINFMTPPDGQNGKCRMFLWNTATPYRDGDFEAGIVIHELTHGLSTRLTGGPANSGCLGWGESGGMGEGWGDFLATTIRSTENYSDYSMGAWAANRDNGIRNFKYSVNTTVNPSTYKTLDKPGYWGVHAIGEVWAEILFVVSQRLIAKHGFVQDLFPPTPLENGTVPVGDFYRPVEYTAAGKPKPLVPKHGNSLSIQLVLNGMKLQQCRPSFFDARDAIIQADQILTGGENFCTLWGGFSERGLGPDARVEGRTPWGGGIRTDDYELPTACDTDKESWVLV